MPRVVQDLLRCAVAIPFTPRICLYISAADHARSVGKQGLEMATLCSSALALKRSFRTYSMAFTSWLVTRSTCTVLHVIRLEEGKRAPLSHLPRSIHLMTLFPQRTTPCFDRFCALSQVLCSHSADSLNECKLLAEHAQLTKDGKLGYKINGKPKSIADWRCP